MSDTFSEKLIVGPKLRRLRQSMEMTQTAMAKALDISVSYLNLMERNQRPMSAKVLLRLIDVYDIDIAQFAPGSDGQLINEITNALNSVHMRGVHISRPELEDCVSASPDFAQCFLDLFARFETLSMQQSLNAGPLADRDTVELRGDSAKTVEGVRKLLDERDNYLDEIDRAAEAMSEELNLHRRQPNTALSDRLFDVHKIRTRIVPADILPGQLSAYDPHLGRLDLSELLPQSGRRFRIAYQLGILERRDLFDSVIAKAILPTREADALMRVSIANYFAAATLMPYGRFLTAAQDCRYDVERLTRRFDTSYEQTAHRLTTLQRPSARGIPFFFVRVDTAGNISKRFSGGRFHFSRFGGACPLWNVHSCFSTPGETKPQIIEMNDGTQYFSIARAVLRPEGAHGQNAQMVAIGLGCDMKYAGDLIYASEMKTVAPTPIGVNCYVCERQNCRARAHAPINRRLLFDERSRGQSIFKFEN